VKRNGTKRYICETKRTETNQNDNVPKPCYIGIGIWRENNLLKKNIVVWCENKEIKSNNFNEEVYNNPTEKYKYFIKLVVGERPERLWLV
jgi:hypothetical protein